MINKDVVSIYSKNSKDKFDIKLILSDIDAGKLFETNENYLSIKGYNKSALYDIKNFKLIKENKDSALYLNEKIKMKKGELGTVIYGEFFEKEILNFHENILCITKKMDDTYLAGGYHFHIYQLYFDIYGFIEIISEFDSGYGYYEDDLQGDCIYSIPASRYYSVGYIEECKNGNILTISDLDKIKKIWRC